MLIHMDPEIAQIFQQSTSVSMSKGKSSFLMKASAKRRRTRQEIDEDKEREMMKQAEIEDKLAELEQLKQQMAEFQEKIEVANRVENQFQQLASEGKMRLFGDG